MKTWISRLLSLLLLSFARILCAATISVDDAPPGTDITVKYDGITAPTKLDWIAIYEAGPSRSWYGSIPASLKWLRTDGTDNGVLRFTSSGLAEGAYTVRLYSNDGYIVLASCNFNILPDSRPVLICPNVSKGGSIVCDFIHPFRSTGEWIGLYRSEDSVSTPRGKKYLPATLTSGSVSFSSSDLAPGKYSARLYRPGNALLASQDFSITGGPGLSAVVDGQNIVVSFKGIAQPNPQDNIRIFLRGAADDYSSGDSHRTGGLAEGKLNIPIDRRETGAYEVRFFGKNGNTLLASADFQISPSIRAPSVASGAPITVYFDSIPEPSADDRIAIGVPKRAAGMGWHATKTTGTGTGSVVLNLSNLNGNLFGTYTVRYHSGKNNRVIATTLVNIGQTSITTLEGDFRMGGSLPSYKSPLTKSLELLESLDSGNRPVPNYTLAPKGQYNYDPVDPNKGLGRSIGSCLGGSLGVNLKTLYKTDAFPTPWPSFKLKLALGEMGLKLYGSYCFDGAWKVVGDGSFSVKSEVFWGCFLSGPFVDPDGYIYLHNRKYRFKIECGIKGEVSSAAQATIAAEGSYLRSAKVTASLKIKGDAGGSLVLGKIVFETLNGGTYASTGVEAPTNGFAKNGFELDASVGGGISLDLDAQTTVIDWSAEKRAGSNYVLGGSVTSNAVLKFKVKVPGVESVDFQFNYKYVIEKYGRGTTETFNINQKATLDKIQSDLRKGK